MQHLRIKELAQAERTAADIADLTDLWKASVKATHQFCAAEDLRMLEHEVPDYLGQVPRLFVAYCEEHATCVGFAGMSGDEITMLFVAPQSFGSGVGSGLVEHLIQTVGVRRVEVNEHNEAARAFYEARGFVVVDRMERDAQMRPYPILGMDRLVPVAQRAGLDLRSDEAGLVLVQGNVELRADFSAYIPRLKPDRVQRELLVRAARIKGVEHPCAIDATAGLGQDALLLAASGCTVTMYERNPVLAAMVRQALQHARLHPALSEIAQRMSLIEMDSIEALQSCSFAPDVVYLDPMFPARTKHAAVKKKLQMIQMLEEPCCEDEVLMSAALQAHPRKIIVKRPAKGPWFAQVRPSHSCEGKAVRFDCIVPPRR